MSASAGGPENRETPDPSCPQPQPAAPGSPGLKARICYLTDAVLAVNFCAMIGSGLVMEFVLGCRRGPGCARFGSFAEETVLGMRFETWAKIHFYLAIGLAALVILHIALHWRHIVSAFPRLIPGRPVRLFSAVLLAGICAFLLLLPFMP